MAPFYVHKNQDYMLTKHHSYLSRCRNVMSKIESLLLEIEPDLKLINLSLSESRVKFAAGFNLLCAYIYPTLSQLEIDLKHLGDAMYLTLYDATNKKRKADRLLNV